MSSIEYVHDRWVCTYICIINMYVCMHGESGRGRGVCLYTYIHVCIRRVCMAHTLATGRQAGKEVIFNEQNTQFVNLDP